MTIRATLVHLTGSGLMAAGVGALVAVILVWGMWVGERDAKLAYQAERRAAVQKCAAAGQLAVLVAREPPLSDGWLCIGGSGRALPHP